MATQGPFYPGTVTTVQEAGDDNDWTTPNGVDADDGIEAQITAATYDANDLSFLLKASNLGFTIPAGSTIDGITVEIERRDFAGNARDNTVQLLDAAGAKVGDNKALTATDWPGTATVQSYGGSADTWAATPTPAMVNDVDFGVALKVLATAANTDIGVDFIRVTVTYTPPPVDPTRGLISWAEFEAPLAPTRGLLSWAELETPLAPTRGLISFAEFEVPIAPTRGLVSWAELEAPSLPDPTRGLVSRAEFETPPVSTRGLISWVELEVPVEGGGPGSGESASVSWILPTRIGMGGF